MIQPAHKYDDFPGEESPLQLAGVSSRSFVISGVLSMILGIAAISVPFAASIAFGLFFGIVLLASSLVQIVFAATHRSYPGFLALAALAVITAAAGLFLLFAPGAGIAVITLILGALFLAEGTLRLIYAIGSDRPGKIWFVVNGSITLLLGLIILSGWPQSSALMLGVLIGVSLFVSGLAAVTAGAAVRRYLI